MENFSTDHPETPELSHIKGWGIDADPKNDPTYPMRQGKSETIGAHGDRPAQQAITTEILRSIERPNLTAVFGTSTPPSGLSGVIRRFAFRYGEGSYGHWLPLLLADRVNSVEGIVADLVRGHIPNICAEQGMKAEWKHNQKAVVKKVTVATALVTVAILWLGKRSNK